MRPVRMLSRSLRVLFCVVAAMVFPCLAFGQTFQVNVSAPATATVGNNIAYTITVNNSTSILLPGVQVTSVFPSSLQFVSANPTNSSASSGMVTFLVTQLNPGQSAQLTLTLRATQAGTVTNVVTATSGQLAPAVDSAVTTVSGQQQGRSDLSLTITPPAGPIFVDDWVAYRINVTRQGDPVSGVFVTNIIPGNSILQGYFPSNGVSINGSRLIFNLGTLSLQSTQLNVTIQPTSAGIVQLLAQVRGGTDTNTANNTATNSFTVTNGVPGQLEATRASDQSFNPQNALFEQLITVRNLTTTNLPSARVILEDFPYRLVNAVGTNDGNPFVVHAGQLTNGQTVELLLEYAFPDRTPKDDPELVAYSVGTVDLTPPSSGTNVAITNIHFLPASGPAVLTTNRLLIEFPATRSNRYQIIYSTNASFSPVFKAMPPIVAQANRVQWIDYGPPKTLSRPATETTVQIPVFITNMFTNTVISNKMPIITVTNLVTTNFVPTNIPSMRFYRALQLP
jgi:uncharacterized repeat protein (TIGR01451 family)